MSMSQVYMCLCRLSAKDVVLIALDIAQGLSRVHSKQVVHQDLHSGNVLQALDGSGYRIADFGNAAYMFQADGSRTCLKEPW